MFAGAKRKRRPDRRPNVLVLLVPDVKKSRRQQQEATRNEAGQAAGWAGLALMKCLDGRSRCVWHNWQRRPVNSQSCQSTVQPRAVAPAAHARPSGTRARDCVAKSGCAGPRWAWVLVLKPGRWRYLGAFVFSTHASHAQLARHIPSYFLALYLARTPAAATAPRYPGAKYSPPHYGAGPPRIGWAFCSYCTVCTAVCCVVVCYGRGRAGFQAFPRGLLNFWPPPTMVHSMHTTKHIMHTCCTLPCCSAALADCTLQLICRCK